MDLSPMNLTSVVAVRSKRALDWSVLMKYGVVGCMDVVSKAHSLAWSMPKHSWTIEQHGEA